MSLWMIRAGQRGEYEQKFINDKCFYITWNDLKCDLSCFSSRDDLKNKLKELYPDDKNNTIRTWASQLWNASHEIKKGDCNLPERKDGGEKDLYVSCNNGDAFIDFQNE